MCVTADDTGFQKHSLVSVIPLYQTNDDCTPCKTSTLVSKAMEESTDVTQADHSFTNTRFFSLFIATIIAVNAIFLGIETDCAELHICSDPNDMSTGLWYAIEIGFTSIFCIELMLRVYAERYSFLLDGWNLFDSILVLIAFVDTFILESISHASGEAMDLFSVMRILRVMRVARIFRLLRFFKKLWLLVIGVLDAMRSLFWAWILITIIIYIFAIFLTRTLGKVYAKDDAVIEEQFGTVVRSMFTLFQVMTLEGWPTIARNAMRHEPWIWLIFILFLVGTTFSIMNVIVAVIVESTLEQAMHQKADTMKQEEAEARRVIMSAAEVFRATDANSDGQITKDEFLKALKRPDVYAYLKEMDIDVRQAENLFDILDFDDSGALDAREFTSGVLKARGQARAKDVLAVQCNIWRMEKVLCGDLQRLCKEVDSRMNHIDQEVDLLHGSLDMLRQNLHLNKVHATK